MGKLTRLGPEVMSSGITSGPSRVSLPIQLDVPAGADAPWTLAIPRGLIVLASADRSRDPPLLAWPTIRYSITLAPTRVRRRLPPRWT